MHIEKDTEAVPKSRGQRIHDEVFAAAAIAATIFAGFMLGRTVVDPDSNRNPWVISLVLVIMAGVALMAIRQARTTHTYEPIEEKE